VRNPINVPGIKARRQENQHGFHRALNKKIAAHRPGVVAANREIKAKTFSPGLESLEVHQ
jgi:hypothetical protein